MSSPSKLMMRGVSLTILVYLLISRFAVARSSSVTSAGSGNSAISLIGVGDDTFRSAQASAAVEELTRNGVCDHRAMRESEGRELRGRLSRGLHLYDGRRQHVLHSS